MGPIAFAKLIFYGMTGRLKEVRLQPGDRVHADAHQMYIVTRGTGQVVRDGPGGHDILLRIVRPGAVIENGDTLEAETPLVLLTLGGSLSRRDRAAC
jgi:hypothetical protein